MTARGILVACLEGARTADNWQRWTPMSAARDAYGEARYQADGVINGDTFEGYDEEAWRAMNWIEHATLKVFRRRYAGRTRQEMIAVLEHAVAEFDKGEAIRTRQPELAANGEGG